MNIIVQSLGFTAGQSLEAFVKEKINTLKSDKISQATVTLYKGPASETADDYCEIRLDMPGNDPFVKKHNEHFETAINECIDVLQEMLQRQKEKDIDARKGNADLIQDFINEVETDEDPDLEDVVK